MKKYILLLSFFFVKTCLSNENNQPKEPFEKKSLVSILKKMKDDQIKMIYKKYIFYKIYMNKN